ncbi:DUF6159 family protein [Stratiformator vulcanicus]|uniref:Glycerophosphoryl diester phosphodiesterase membrane domain-containing protein n=1 Tax=Stratiformator vulcanicus TaxID=2527980 RepID=A0A517R5N7_9PLAN|nr:DUF6159 family protein [Stratiformator vulcanicus]QDT39204.1 hypothetical protein Pan189_36070 [Stratiformator vulcanicus]
MFRTITNGIDIARQSLRVIALDKELLIFPALSGLSLTAVLVSFALPLWGLGYADVVMAGNATEEAAALKDDPIAYVILFAFYYVNFFVITFFNAALVSCAIYRFHGGDPTIMTGLRAATSRLPQIAAWAFVAASVGFVLKIIEGRSEQAGRIIAGILGATWGILTYFVVPVLVVEKLGPIEAVKRSVSVVRETWGEAITANIGIGLMTFFACLFVIAIPIAVGILAGPGTLLVGAVILAVLLLILIGLISATLNAIVIAALYEYAAEGEVPQQFNETTLRYAFGDGN